MASNNHKSSGESDQLTQEIKMKLVANFVKNLEVIGEVNEYQKLTVDSNNQLMIDNCYYTQGIIRRIYGNGREVTIQAIDNLITDLFKFTDKLLHQQCEEREFNKLNIAYDIEKNEFNNDIKNFKDKNTDILKQIVESLTNCNSGLQNLKVTYLEDNNISNRLDLIISKIENRITTINKMLKNKPL